MTFADADLLSVEIFDAPDLLAITPYPDEVRAIDFEFPLMGSV